MLKVFRLSYTKESLVSQMRCLEAGQALSLLTEPDDSSTARLATTDSPSTAAARFGEACPAAATGARRAQCLGVAHRRAGEGASHGG